MYIYWLREGARGGSWDGTKTVGSARRLSIKVLREAASLLDSTQELTDPLLAGKEVSF